MVGLFADEGLEFGGLEFVGNEDFLGDRGGEFVILGEKGAEDFAVFAFFEFVGFEDEVFGLEEVAVADLEEVEVGGALDDGVVDDVFVFGAGGGDFLFLEDVLDFLDFVANFGGFFEFFCGGVGVHLGAEVFDDVFAAAFEEFDDIFNDGFVFGFGAFGDAGSDAAFDVVVEAGVFEDFVGDFDAEPTQIALCCVNSVAFSSSYWLIRLRRKLLVSLHCINLRGLQNFNPQITMAEREEFFEEFEGVLDFVFGGFGADVFGAVFFDLADDLDAREGFFGDADVDEVFVVFHDDVVFRLELFDEVVFEDDGFEFGVGFDYFDVCDIFNKFARARGMGVIGFEVLFDAFV